MVYSNKATTQISDKKPDRFAFIIGAMKCGTTSMFDILSQHPQVCPSKKKEPDYFTKDSYDNSHEAYLSLWNWRDGKHSIALESSVAYTKEPYITGVPERINRAKLGQYRFIYMLRNPLTRIESQVRHGLFAGWGKSLDAGIPEDAINFSSYVMQLDKYLEYYPKDSIMLITLEEFRLDPHAVLSRICEFLEINKTFEFKDVTTTRNSGEFFNASVNISRITQSRFGQYFAHNILPAKIKTLLRNFIVRFSKKNTTAFQHGRWQLTDEECILILNRLSDDLRRLELEFGVNIQRDWNVKSSTFDRID